jgi:hypothetical protein
LRLLRESGYYPERACDLFQKLHLALIPLAHSVRDLTGKIEECATLVRCEEGRDPMQTAGQVDGGRLIMGAECPGAIKQSGAIAKPVSEVPLNHFFLFAGDTAISTSHGECEFYGHFQPGQVK